MHSSFCFRFLSPVPRHITRVVLAAVVAIALAGVVPSSGQAGPVEAPSYDPGPYEIGWFFNDVGTVRTRDVTPGVPVSLYALLFDAQEPIVGYELALAGLPPGAFVFRTEFFGPSPVGGEQTNFIVATGGCVQPDPITTLVELDLLFTSSVAPCTILSMTGSTPSSSASGRPVVVRCNQTIQELPLYGEFNGGPWAMPGQVAMNVAFDSCLPVTDDHTTFSSLKARF